MTAAQREIREAIAFYDERDWDWTSLVTFLGIKHEFGGWEELMAQVRRPWGRRQAAERDAKEAE